MRRHLNVRLALILLVTTIALGAGVHTLHGFQVERSADILLKRAQQSEDEGDLEEAARNLRVYLGQRPNDVEVLVEYADLLDRQAEGVRDRLQALFALEKVLRLDPDREESRREVAAMAADLGRYRDVEDHLWEGERYGLLRSSPGDADLLLLLGRCREDAGAYENGEAIGDEGFAAFLEAAGQGGDAEGGEVADFLDEAGAVELYRAAIARDPGLIDAYVRAARVLGNRLEDAQGADEAMDAMVSANGQDGRAYLERARYRAEGDPGGAGEDIARALELAPDDVEVLLTAATLAGASGEFDAARDHLEHGLEVDPGEVRLYETLARVEAQAGRFEEALAAIERGLETAGDRDQPSLLVSRADTLVQAGELERAEEEIAALRRRRDIAQTMPELLHARVLIAQEKWEEAVEALELAKRLTGNLVPEGKEALLAQADFLLGRCHQQLGDPREQLAAFDRVLDANRQSVPARLGRAAALVALGDPERALVEYRMLMDEEPAVAINLARLQIAENRRLPESQRRWDEVERALDLAERQEPGSVAVTLLRVEALGLQGRFDEARQLLARARSEDPGRVELWVALAPLVERQESPAAALAVLDEAEQKLGDLTALRLARIGPLLRRGGDDLRASLASLEEGLDSFEAEEAGRLLGGLAQAHVRLGDLDKARGLWERAVELDPGNVEAQAVLFDFALRDGDDAAMAKAVEAIKAAEGGRGGEGVLWRYCEAAQFVARAENGKPDRLTEARLNLASVTQARPDWPNGHLLLARVNELQNLPDEAIASYQKAVELGEGRPEVLGRLAQLLDARGRPDEAQAALDRMPEGAALDGEAGRTAARLALARGDKDRAIALARQAAPEDSQNPADHLWLGQFLAAAEQAADAEAALRRATDLGGEQPGPWIALVRFLAAAERPAEAEAAVEAARKALPQDQAPMALAACYEAMGRREEAEQQYRAALAADPEDRARREALANFYMRTGQPDKAEPLLGEAVEALARATPRERAQARRSQALAILMADGGRRVQEAQRLIEKNLEELGDSVEDRRLRALMLATQPRLRREAIRQVEDLSRGQDLSPGERFLLAQLYVAEEDWTSARRRLLSLLASEGDNPQYVAYYAAGLLDHDDDREAATWIERLERLEPDAFRTVALKARLLKEQGQGDRAASLLESHASSHPDRAVAVAQILEQLEQLDAAEAAYRKAAEADATVPALALAGFLGRRGRLEEALDVLEARWGKEEGTSEAIAEGALALLYADLADPDLEQAGRVANLLDAALREGSRTPAFVFQLANIRLLQGRYSEAARLFRESNELEGEKSGPLNNLAWIYAVHEGKSSEALSLINRAIVLDGLDPVLLDTRAVVHLTMDRPDLAVEDLLEATARLRRGDLYYHLALAHQKAGDREAAAEALRRSRDAGFTPDMVHPLEREVFADLIRQLERN